MKKTNAKFYCENCGAEVPSNARMCKHCGRFFSAVRCPQCGATGTVSKFEKGCPVCGYAMSSDELNGMPSSLLHENQKRRMSRAEKKNLKAAFASHNTTKKTDKMQGDGTLPLWIYAVTIVVLGSVIAALVLLLRRS
ncbi:MAG: zinc ribbon domain-containing protein [Treponema sp.]|nr:zinc ribbon domain-containing protein [Treponema sp.]